MTDVHVQAVKLQFNSFSLQPTHLANFNQVQSIQYSPLEEKDRKGMLQLNVAGAPEVTYAHKCARAHTHIFFLNVRDS